MAGNSVILKMAAQTPLVAERYRRSVQGRRPARRRVPVPAPEPRQTWRRSSPIRASASSPSPARFPAATRCSRPRPDASSPPASSSAARIPPTCAPDADSSHAVENLVDGSYFNSGQSCCGIERIYVDQEDLKSFVEGFVDLTRQYKLGNPLETETNLGPLVRTDAADAVRAQISRPSRKGAKALSSKLPRTSPARPTCRRKSWWTSTTAWK